MAGIHGYPIKREALNGSCGKKCGWKRELGSHGTGTNENAPSPFSWTALFQWWGPNNLGNPTGTAGRMVVCRSCLRYSTWQKTIIILTDRCQKNGKPTLSYSTSNHVLYFSSQMRSEGIQCNFGGLGVEVYTVRANICNRPQWAPPCNVVFCGRRGARDIPTDHYQRYLWAYGSTMNGHVIMLMLNSGYIKRGRSRPLNWDNGLYMFVHSIVVLLCLICCLKGRPVNPGH
jgi:hypothetical protein